jgi:3-methylcrotonyl-CoA carboxylase alpha subunit
MLASVLIANRGEIACRVIRTAQRMGLRTVAVYSDADRDALHVAMADSAYRIGPPPARESYLRGDVILEVAARANADSIHPGYGFLSENADFAEACAAAGRIFVGPPPDAIRAMGGKSQAKALMGHAGVPLVPGYHGDAQDAETLRTEAQRIGYPVLIKASAGGGGKGMRIVTDAAELPDAITGAKREALASFGDDRVLIERYLQRPRHVEIQVFADTHGNCISLFERDCSVQRRHQKIIEEAPAPGLAPAMRHAMGQAAVAAARAVGYVGAGTVEFIVENGAFHFMEMNTRLQVEHPVTEMITGLDLVEWQFRVASGERLPLLEPRIDGHAIEVRLYAEDPAQEFRPSVGTLLHLKMPELSAQTRIDTGVREGDRVGIDYDPMIAKLIVHAPDRAAAVRRLGAALADCEIAGVQTNLALLRAIAENAEFGAGGIDTGFLGRNPDLLRPATAEFPPAAIAAVTLAVLARPDPYGAQTNADAHSPWSARDSWRLNLRGSRTVTLRHDDTTITVTASATHDTHRLQWDGADHVAAAVIAGARMTLRLDDATLPASILDLSDRIIAIVDGVSHSFDIVDPLAPPSAANAAGGRTVAPIPGRIASVLVAPGDAVKRAQPLVVMEAMKMELTLSATADGVVAEVRCRVGDMVEDGWELVTFTDAESPS